MEKIDQANVAKSGWKDTERAMKRACLVVLCLCLVGMGVSATEDMDGRVIDEAIKPDAVTTLERIAAEPGSSPESSTDAVYSAEDEREITRRLADLGYL